MNAFVASLFRRKNSQHIHHVDGLKRCLTSFDLTLLGIGAIIGAGIFVLTGVAAATKAGPALILSYGLAAVACGFSALAYAELSASLGGCGSAYGYAYAALGELPAWVIGWYLLLEYGMSCSAVAVGWSSYVDNALTAIGIHLPNALKNGPWEGGIIDIPAVAIVLTICAMLYVGVKESTKFNIVIVTVKMLAIAVFIMIASMHFDVKNWHPFMPFGWQGIANGAAFIFFAYIGFDAVSTAAEETINPQRDLPIGIMGSLLICTLVFMLVTALLTGAASYTTLDVGSPVSDVVLRLGYRFGAAVIAVGAIAGLTTVILVMYYGLTRVILAMSRDGLLPKWLAHVHSKRLTPARAIIIMGVLIATLAGLVPIEELAQVVNIGTLAAFTTVCIGVLVLRYTQPDLHRPFKTPFSPWTPLLGAASCLYLMYCLPGHTWQIFGVWTISGLLLYFLFSRNKSLLHIRELKGR